MAEASLERIRDMVEEVAQNMRTARRVQDQHTRCLGRIEREIVNLHQDFADQSVRMDTIAECLTRIERRLPLVDAG